MSRDLAANQHATFDEYDAAMREHNRDAASILHQLLGALGHLDESGAGDDVKARTLDSYAAQVREWDARRPEWVR